MTHMVVDRTNTPPVIKFYNVNASRYSKDHCDLFTPSPGRDTYVNMIGGNGIDCNDDEYYDI